MDEQTKTTRNNLGTLAEDASALMAATADVAGAKVEQARKHLSGAMENAREKAGAVADKAAACVKATDEAVREYPYHAMGIALGVGALIGCLLSRGNRSRHSD